MNEVMIKNMDCPHYCPKECQYCPGERIGRGVFTDQMDIHTDGSELFFERSASGQNHDRGFEVIAVQSASEHGELFLRTPLVKRRDDQAYLNRPDRLDRRDRRDRSRGLLHIDLFGATAERFGRVTSVKIDRQRSSQFSLGSWRW